jgi:hypothetical protein
MFLDNKIIKIFRDSFLEQKSLEENQAELTRYRNTTIGTYNLKTSRNIWMSLILFKFKDIMNVNEILWNQSKKLIISILKNKYSLDANELDNIVNEYTILFEIWKKQDMKNFMFEIASIYYNILQIKKSIQNTNDNNTILEWEVNYNTLLENIRSKCKKINGLEILDESIQIIENQKYNMIKEMMDRAYWDNIYDMMENNNFTLVIENLYEIKNMIIEIIPEKIKLDSIDIDYTIQMIKHKCISIEYILNLFTNIILLLKEWDSYEFQSKYNNDIDMIKTITSTEDNNRIIVNLLNKIMIYTIDLKNRKAIWKKLLINF